MSSKYINDPREEEIRPESGITLEEANRKETMYHWGAMVLDLCNLPPEEYMTTIFHTEDVSSSGGSGSVVTNTMSVSISDSTFTAEFPYQVASNLCIVITDSDGAKDIINISAGQSSPVTAELQSVDPSKIETMYIGPTEEQATSTSYSDDKYKYVISEVPPVQSRYVKYCYMKHTDVEEGLTEEKVVAAGVSDASVNGKNSTFEYEIEPVLIPGFNDMDEEDYQEIIEEEQLDLLIFASSRVSSILLNETDDQTDDWNVNYTTLSINGKDYFVSRYIDQELVNICDTDYQEPSNINIYYKITME